MEVDGQVVDRLRQASSLEDLVQQIGARDLLPGWVPRGPQTPLAGTMRSRFVPAHWRYAEAKAAMQAAGRLIGTDLAERRNFVMRNPVPGNEIATLSTLVCAYQSILPGEKARSHRHTPHALRVILEARGAYSVVNGDKHPMESGDIVLTPGGCWHGHGHDGSEQAFWFDGLDVPLTHLLETMRFEDHPDTYEKIGKTSDRSPMRFAWTDILRDLERAPMDAHGCFGKSIELPAPTMPTISLRVGEWPKGWRNRPYRHVANTIYVVMRGEGRSTVEGKSFDWQFGDAIAAPSWSRIEHQSSEDSVVFSMSDEPVMRWSRYYEFEKL